MNRADRRYLELYVQRRRLMTLDQRENADSINTLTLEIEALRSSECVSEKVIALAPHAPWR